jgi:hypothetical protein
MTAMTSSEFNDRLQSVMNILIYSSRNVHEINDHVQWTSHENNSMVNTNNAKHTLKQCQKCLMVFSPFLNDHEYKRHVRAHDKAK